MYRLIAIFTVIIALLSLNTRNSSCSWVYKTFGELIEESDAVIVGKVFAIKKDGGNKYAYVKVEKVLKGNIVPDTVIRLPFREKEEGPVYVSNSNWYPITYKRGKQYILLLNKTENGYVLYPYPSDTKIEISNTNKLLISEIYKLIKIDTIESEKEKVLRLIKLLTSPMSKIRESAALSLGKFECKEAFDGLVEALKNDNRQVRKNAAHCLWSLAEKGIKVREAIPVLTHSLLKNECEDIEQQFKVSALITIGGKEVQPTLLEIIRRTDTSCEVTKSRAVFALADISGTSVLPIFIEMLKSDPNPYVRWSVAVALGKIGDRSAISALINGLRDTNWRVQNGCIEALEILTNYSFGDRWNQKEETILKWEKWWEEHKKD